MFVPISKCIFLAEDEWHLTQIQLPCPCINVGMGHPNGAQGSSWWFSVSWAGARHKGLRRLQCLRQRSGTVWCWDLSLGLALASHGPDSCTTFRSLCLTLVKIPSRSVFSNFCSAWFCLGSQDAYTLGSKSWFYFLISSVTLPFFLLNFSH